MSNETRLVIAYANGDGYRMGDRRTVSPEECRELTQGPWVTLCPSCDRSQLLCIFNPCGANEQAER